MTTSDDSIVAFIKEVRAQDRRADRERIAELERDAAHLRKLNLEIVDTYNRELDELTEKCAALVCSCPTDTTRSAPTTSQTAPRADAWCLCCGPTSPVKRGTR